VYSGAGRTGKEGSLLAEAARRPTWAEVDLEALRHNVRTLAGRLRPGAGLLAVVKADAYGHGAVPVARAALEAGASWLGVAVLEEGVALRRAGITARILVMGWTPAERAAEVVAADLDQAVFTLADAEALAAAARAQGRLARLHAKLDTGMGRLGWPVRPRGGPGGLEAAVTDIARAARLPGAALVGVFTHFADADGPDLDGARRQLSAFRAALEGLEAEGVRPEVRHAANTAALLRLPEAHFDLCRPGIGLYGYLPSAHVPDPGLRPVLTWHTRVAQVKDLEPGEAVSYGGTYVAAARERVATLPVGYADGFPRALSNRGRILLGGRPAPVRGRVCMDQIVVSAEGCGPVRQGDPAVILGTQGGARQWADDLAAQLGTIPYEVLCAIGPRVPRVYRGA
jgi:alanine racemase